MYDTAINQPEEFDKLSKNEQEIIIKWILKYITSRKTFNDRYSSYHLKHVFEYDKKNGGFYMTNGAFKGAMIKTGYIPDNPFKMNPVYCISNKSPFIMYRDV